MGLHGAGDDGADKHLTSISNMNLIHRKVWKL